MDKLIVITPAYNAEKYIKECGNSILGQNYDNLEWVIINDGSKDNTLNVINEMASQDSRIVVINQENKGASAARNAGLNYCYNHQSAKHFTFLDADDLWMSNMLQAVMKILKDTDADFISYKYNIDKIGSDYRTKKTNVNDEITPKNIKIYTNPWENLKNDYPIDWKLWTKIYKISTFRNIYFKENLKIAEDFLFAWEIRAKANKIVSIDNNIVLYRDTPMSLSKLTPNITSIANEYYAAEQIYKIYMNDNFSLKTKKYVLRIVAKIYYRNYIKTLKNISTEIKELIINETNKGIQSGVFNPKFLPLKKLIPFYIIYRISKDA